MSFRVAGLAAVLCLAGQCAPAQEAGGFTFRRIAAPPAGQAPKITVQIDPADYDAWMEGTGEETSQVPDDLPSAAPVTEWDWFWEAVSPQITDTGPANTALALQTLAAKPAAPAPRLQALRDITGAHGRDILSATVGTDVSPALVVALIAVESSGRVSAESDAGAQGLMQLIPDTAARFGVEDPTDPAQNIKGGVAYLAWLLEQFDRDPRAGGLQRGRERGEEPRRCAALCRDTGLCAQGAERLAGGTRAVHDTA